MMSGVYSNNEISVIYALIDATEQEQEEVKSIFFEVVKKNNLDSNASNLKVADSDDGPVW